MFKNRFLILVLIVVAAFGIVSACKTGLLAGEQPPVGPTKPDPPAPVVVDGMRTSYADVVEKTSPAVVRIEADHKEKASPVQQFPFGDDMLRQFGIPNQRQSPSQRPQIERGMGSGVPNSNTTSSRPFISLFTNVVSAVPETASPWRASGTRTARPVT